jgi:hypothetical protein
MASKRKREDEPGVHYAVFKRKAPNNEDEDEDAESLVHFSPGTVIAER